MSKQTYYALRITNSTYFTSVEADSFEEAQRMVEYMNTADFDGKLDDDMTENIVSELPL